MLRKAVDTLIAHIIQACCDVRVKLGKHPQADSCLGDHRYETVQNKEQTVFKRDTTEFYRRLNGQTSLLCFRFQPQNGENGHRFKGIKGSRSSVQTEWEPVTTLLWWKRSSRRRHHICTSSEETREEERVGKKSEGGLIAVSASAMRWKQRTMSK